MLMIRKLRKNLQIFKWIRAGLPIPPVPAVKRAIIHGLLDRHGLDIFVETGTYKGDTLAEIADRGLRSISIELSDLYFAKAKKRFSEQSHIELHHGDSGLVLPGIVQGLTKPALFWLDGHYSAGDTAHGAEAAPLHAEIAAIMASPIKGHVILIDDAHEMSGQAGYPELGRFLSDIAADGRYSAYVHANIVVLESKVV
jgi:hypothetical protein